MTPSEILYQLIATPSVNPMEIESDPTHVGERQMSDLLVAFFDEWEVDYERIAVAPHRDNIIARYQADGSPSSRRTILLDAHQDTVPVRGMTIPPFEPQTRQGRIYGRGACDVKGSMAAMLHAFRRLCFERPPNADNVVLCCSCDEESTATGVRQMVNYWQPGNGKSRLLSAAPDVAIVAEPTNLHVVVAHRGVVRFRIHTLGRACHSSFPEQGKNAIYLMSHVIARLEHEAEILTDQSDVHPLCGGPRLSVCRVQGGTAVNIVPDQCTIEIDRRLMPGENPERVWQALCQCFSDLGSNNVSCESPWISCPALDDNQNSDLAAELLKCSRSEIEDRSTMGVPYCTNASTIAAAGIPTVVCGAGSIDQAHTVDEWVEVEQVNAAAELYFRFCAGN